MDGRPRRSRAVVTTAVAALVGLLAVGFLVRSIVVNWSQVREAVADANYLLLGSAVLLAALAMAHLGMLWGNALALFNHRAGRTAVVVWWFVGELGKYVPGGVLSVVGRAEVARRAGAGRAASYGSVPLSLALRYFSGMLLFAVLLPFDLANQRSSAALVVVLLVPVGLAALHPAVVTRLLALARRLTRRPLDLPVPTWGQSIREVLAYLPNWVLIIASTWCTARAFDTDVAVLPVALATLLSWTVGFLVFPVPAGAGLREAIFAASSGLPAGLAATVAIASRLIFIVVDGAGAAVCFPMLRRSGGRSVETSPPPAVP